MIDIRTFMLVLGIGNIGFALLMAGYARGAASHPAMRIWAGARLVQGAAHLVGWLQPELAWSALVATGNALLMIGTALELAAYCVFLALPRWAVALLPFTALALLALYGAQALRLDAVQGMVLMSMALGLFSLAMAWLLLRPGAHGSVLQRLIGVNNLVFAVAMAVRAWHGLGHTHASLLSAAGAHHATFIAGYILMIVNGFGFLLLCKEKDDARMVQLATIDSLTGLINRHAFFDRTDSARMLARRQCSPIALMMIDIDHFKRINDCFGHATGDEALVLFAATAGTALRDHDIMGRLGGEEFALVLPATDLEGAILAAERLRMTVAAAPLPTSAGAYAMTISVGVVVIDAHEHINAALARADHALYAAKTGGRNRVSVGVGQLKVVCG
ncbi:diguanylate cyclase [Massilia sp. DWR3-1-1]|uniref:GGDEF domain-containing protein n=1 Tax=Massilia sp. DWR3-1-1 TaxID=2804559 RepID=UPI003CF1EBB0